MNMFPDRSESKTLKRARSSIETAHRLDTLYVTETTLLTAEEGTKNAKCGFWPDFTEKGSLSRARLFPT
jgi:hypothetical protein